jgi:drug/metabolite transporter (DMT)-like permease
MKKATLSFGPLTIAGLRCLCAALILGGLWRWMPHPRRPDHRELPWLLVLAVLGYAYPFAMVPHLVSLHGSGFIGMMVCFVPLFTVVLSVPILRAIPTRRQILGVLGGLACMAVILKDGATRSIPADQLALTLTVPFCFALTNLTTTRHLRGLSPYLLTLCCVTLVASALAPLGLAVEPIAWNDDLPLAATSVLTLGIASTAVALVAFFLILQRRGPLYAGMVTYLVPLGAVIWGWADAEVVTAPQILALVGVLAMVAVVQRDLARGRAAGLP